MKIIPDKKSKYGNFDLLPTPGFAISHHFTDYQSKLLIVSENTIGDSKKRNVLIPSYTRVIDPVIPKELSFEEYKHHFDYQQKTIFSDDKKLKLVSQRIHEEEPDGDGYEEQLFNTINGEVIAESSGVAFRETKRLNLLEKHLEDERKKEEYRQKEKIKPTLDEYFNIKLKTLEPNETVLVYTNQNSSYKLVFENSVFTLYKGEKIELNAFYEPKEVSYSHFKNFESLVDFWNTFSASHDWYKQFNIFRTVHPVMTSLIIESANQLRKNQNLTLDENRALYNNWERFPDKDELKRGTQKQYCPICGTQVQYSPRYPTYICKTCKNKITDSNGRQVEFFNTAFMGHGCQGYYSGTDQKELYNSQICYIGTIQLKVNEHRFGGIVIQKTDD